MDEDENDASEKTSVKDEKKDEDEKKDGDEKKDEDAKEEDRLKNDKDAFQPGFTRYFKIIRANIPLGGPAIFMQISRTAVHEIS